MVGDGPAHHPMGKKVGHEYLNLVSILGKLTPSRTSAIDLVHTGNLEVRKLVILTGILPAL